MRTHLSWPWVVYNLRRLGHHHLLLSSLCSPQWWYHFWRHRRASRAPNRLYAHLHSAFLRWQWYCWCQVPIGAGIAFAQKYLSSACETVLSLMYRVSRLTHGDHRRAAIIPVESIICSVHLFPQFGPQCSRNWNSSSVLE